MTSPIRHLPRWQIVARLKRRGVRQAEIARRAGSSVGYVNHVLSRMSSSPTPLTERIWAEVERALR